MRLDSASFWSKERELRAATVKKEEADADLETAVKSENKNDNRFARLFNPPRGKRES
jgi:hypothetical protein